MSSSEPSNVINMDERLRSLERRTIDPPGGGGDNGGMDARVSKLEAVIPTLATKVDLMREFNALKLEIIGGDGVIRADMAKMDGSIRTDMHKEFTVQTWRIIGAMLTFGAMLSTAVFFIARYVR